MSKTPTTRLCIIERRLLDIGHTLDAERWKFREEARGLGFTKRELTNRLRNGSVPKGFTDHGIMKLGDEECCISTLHRVHSKKRKKEPE